MTERDLIHTGWLWWDLPPLGILFLQTIFSEMARVDDLWTPGFASGPWLIDWGEMPPPISYSMATLLNTRHD